MIAENPDYTFVFEYISMRDAHVVSYSPEQEGMYLIGIRNILTGKQLSFKEVKDFAAKYYVPMTTIENRSFDSNRSPYSYNCLMKHSLVLLIFSFILTAIVE